MMQTDVATQMLDKAASILSRVDREPMSPAEFGLFNALSIVAAVLRTQYSKEGDTMPEYEALKVAREMATADRQKFENERRGEKMTLVDYEKAIHQVVDEAVASGLDPSDIVDCGVAVIENIFATQE